MPGLRVLSEGEIRAAVEDLDGWDIRDGRLRKEYVFQSFLRALAFVNSVGYLAEAAAHHPDVFISHNRVILRLITHGEEALTDRDFVLAKEIDEKLTSALIVVEDHGQGFTT